MVPGLLHKQHTLNYKSSLQPSTSAFNLGHYSLKVEAYSLTITNSTCIVSGITRIHRGFPVEKAMYVTENTSLYVGHSSILRTR